MTRRVIVAACALMASGAGYFGMVSGLNGLAAQQPSGVEIPAPNSWVAFTADITGTSVPGTAGVSGKYYRSSDGSQRTDTYKPGEPGRRIIDIKNVAQEKYYAWDTRQWTVQPMQLGPNGYRPTRARTERLTRESEPWEGLEVYRFLLDGGSQVLMAPALNFFRVVEIKPSGRRIQYSNIVLTEPDPTLFEPPAGAQVTELSGPGGIIVKPNPRRPRR
jgi:hypothetical protein